jgi:hypothetical protein
MFGDLPITRQGSYGWRAGSRYIHPGASAAAVIRYEQDEHGNALEVPEFVLEELDRQHLKAQDVVWVCRTREHARRYGGPGLRQPYKELFGPSALILATDGEPEMGYLVLCDASRLDLSVIEQFALYRRSRKGAAISRQEKNRELG